MLANLSVDQAIMKARSHAKKGEIEEAQKLYQSILKNFSKNKRAQEGLSSLNNLKPNDVKQKPSQEVINQLVGLYNQGQLLTVVERAQVLTKQYPEAFIIWNILGAVRSQIGMFDEAVEAYKTTIALKPDYVEAYNNLGIILTEIGKLGEACSTFIHVLKIKQNFTQVYVNLSRLMKKIRFSLNLKMNIQNVCSVQHFSKVFL